MQLSAKRTRETRNNTLRGIQLELEVSGARILEVEHENSQLRARIEVLQNELQMLQNREQNRVAIEVNVCFST